MKIRTSQPSNNKYYIRQVSGGLNGAVAGQPTIKGANVLCNCVGYANGRFNEIIGDPNLNGTVKAFGYQLVCNAEDFIESARRQGLTINPTPIEGGIMVWAKGRPGRGSDGAGHVAVVEEVYADGTILTSESGWNAWAFKTVRRSNSNGRWGQTSAYSFRGCVVNPGVPNPKVVPVPPLVVDGIGGEATVMAMQRFFGTPVDGIISGQIKGLHRYYPSLTAVSYIGAPSTCIKALQKWVGVPDDGYLGADTTKAWQAKLGVKDDGIFGPDSMRAWQKYLNEQQKPEPEPPKPTQKIEEDGIGGPATVKVAQTVFGTQVDGNISGQNEALKKYYPSLTAVTFDKVKSTLVKRLQKWVGVDDDGVWGAATSKGLQHKLNSEGYDAGDEDSIFGERSMRAFQAWLNDHDSPTPDTPQPEPTPKPTPTPSFLDKWFSALRTQYEWSKDQKYEWVSGGPTIANSKKKGTCISLHSVALQRLGLLASKGYFYYNPETKKIAGKSAKYVLNHPEIFEVFYPGKTVKQLWEEGLIKIGDYVGYGGKNYHSMVFKGFNKKGEAIFDTMGHRRGLNITYPYYAKQKVAMIVRLKKV